MFFNLARQRKATEGKTKQNIHIKDRSVRLKGEFKITSLHRFSRSLILSPFPLPLPWEMILNSTAGSDYDLFSATSSEDSLIKH